MSTPASRELAAAFEVGQGSQELAARFNVSKDDWSSQGLHVSVYRDMGKIS